MKYLFIGTERARQRYIESHNLSASDVILYSSPRGLLGVAEHVDCVYSGEEFVTSDHPMVRRAVAEAILLNNIYRPIEENS